MRKYRQGDYSRHVAVGYFAVSEVAEDTKEKSWNDLVSKP